MTSKTKNDHDSICDKPYWNSYIVQSKKSFRKNCSKHCQLNQFGKYTKLIWKQRTYSPCDKDYHFGSYTLEAIWLLTEYTSHK